MERIDLVVLPPSTTVGKAIKAMQRSGKSGFMTWVGGVRVVLDTDALEQGNVDPMTPVGTIRPSKRSIQLKRLLRSIGPDTERALDLHGASFGIADRRGKGSVTVFTRHESLAFGLNRAPIYYQCERNPNHIFLPGMLNKPGRCNLDDAAVRPLS
jgi:hypothetical protein